MLAAAAALCEAAGRVALPYPVAGASCSATATAGPSRSCPTAAAASTTATCSTEWRVATLDGREPYRPRPTGDRLGPRLGPFVADLDAAASTA